MPSTLSSTVSMRPLREQVSDDAAALGVERGPGTATPTAAR